MTITAILIVAIITPMALLTLTAITIAILDADFAKRLQKASLAISVVVIALLTVYLVGTHYV